MQLVVGVVANDDEQLLLLLYPYFAHACVNCIYIYTGCSNNWDELCHILVVYGSALPPSAQGTGLYLHGILSYALSARIE